MSMHMDAAYRSLNKYGEELCGDTVRVTRTADSTIAVLADGLGSGVKANILSTLTASILSTMLNEGASVADAVETLAKTLPVCSERKLAYSTFSVIQIFDSGAVSLVEFDNPSCIFIRNGKFVDLQQCSEVKDCAGKTVTESHFTVKAGDVVALLSDGVIYAGVGQALNFGWSWDSVARWLSETSLRTPSASRLAASLAQAVNELYLNKPGDDSTALVLKAAPHCTVNLLSGPPVIQDDDAQMVHDYMQSPGKHIVCGGTSANLVARMLNRKAETSLSYADADLPPTGSIEGIDLVTEGVLTLTRTVEIVRQFALHSADTFSFRTLDEQNGAARLARILLEDCTELNLFIGTAVNPAHQKTGLQTDLSAKMKMIEELCGLMNRLGKKVIQYYY